MFHPWPSFKVTHPPSFGHSGPFRQEHFQGLAATPLFHVRQVPLTRKLIFILIFAELTDRNEIHTTYRAHLGLSKTMLASYDTKKFTRFRRSKVKVTKITWRHQNGGTRRFWPFFTLIEHNSVIRKMVLVNWHPKFWQKMNLEVQGQIGGTVWLAQTLVKI